MAAAANGVMSDEPGPSLHTGKVASVHATPIPLTVVPHTHILVVALQIFPRHISTLLLQAAMQSPVVSQ